MKNKICASFDDAVVDIPNGATIMFAGFGGVGAPQNLIAALHRQGAYDLTGISNEAGGADGRFDVGTLVQAHRIRKMICCFTGPNPHSWCVRKPYRADTAGRYLGLTRLV